MSGVPRVNPDGTITLRSAPSGPSITVAGPTQIPALPGESSALEYWVDTAAGDDDDDGLTLATAVRTYRYGLSRLLDAKVTPGFVFVHQVGSAAVDDILWPRTFPIDFGGSLYIRGEGATVLAGPVAITGVTGASATARGQVVCAGADFTGMEDRRIRVVSGTGTTQNRVGWIQQVVSPTTINVTQAFDLATQGAGNQFVVGSEIVVESLVTAPVLGMHAPPPRSQGLSFGLESLAVPTDRDFTIEASQMWGCAFDVGSNIIEMRGGVFIFGSYLRSLNIQQTGFAQLVNCSTRITNLDCQSVLFNRSAQKAVGLVVRCGVVGSQNYFQCWDWQANAAALELQNGASASMAARLVGSSAAAGTFGIKTRGGAVYGYNGSGSKPTVAGAAAFNVDVAGTQLLYASVPATSVVAARLSAVCELG